MPFSGGARSHRRDLRLISGMLSYNAEEQGNSMHSSKYASTLKDKLGDGEREDNFKNSLKLVHHDLKNTAGSRLSVVGSCH